jgi:cytochrome c553
MIRILWVAGVMGVLALMPTGVAAQAVMGDAKAGAQKNAMCIGCHGIPGYRASFPQVHQVPMIAGQNAKYIESALDAYRKGDRKHPTMRAVATSLTDQDIADLAAFYSSQGQGMAATPPAATVPATLQAKLVACTACHGANFNNTADPANPKLAGQHADYLYAALQAYRTDGNAVIGRGNPTMVAMARTLTEAEAKQVAGYLGGLQGTLKTVPESRFR